MEIIDYNPKVLHIALSNVFVEDKDGNVIPNGLIYDPTQVRVDDHNFEHHYESFFGNCNDYRLASIKTEQGPGELAKTLGEEFGATVGTHIGDMIAPFTIDWEEATNMFDEMAKNPKKYYLSQEKIWAEKALKKKSL